GKTERRLGWVPSGKTERGALWVVPSGKAEEEPSGVGAQRPKHGVGRPLGVALPSGNTEKVGALWECLPRKQLDEMRAENVALSGEVGKHKEEGSQLRTRVEASIRDLGVKNAKLQNLEEKVVPKLQEEMSALQSQVARLTPQLENVTVMNQANIELAQKHSANVLMKEAEINGC
ncbi:hypothetical protein CYMTET_21217, partial [Cymbomonas tetramitiformis]